MGPTETAADGLHGILGGIALLPGLGKFRLQAFQSISLRHKVTGAEFTLIEQFHIVLDFHSGISLGVERENVFQNGHRPASCPAMTPISIVGVISFWI